MTTGTAVATTRAAVLHGPDDLRIAEQPVRPLGPGDVLVQIAAVGVCGSDLHYVTQGRNGTNELRTPSVLGHEAAGIVRATGAGVDLEPGTAVAIEPAIGCGSCPTCRTGRYNLCPTAPCIGSPPHGGALTEHLVLARDHLHVLPPDLDVELGALIEPLAVAVWAVRRAEVAPGARVLITGAGPIGLLTAQVARAAGATDIWLTDVVRPRLEVARALGLDNTVNVAEEALTVTDVDHAIDCSGVSQVINDACTRIRPGGRLTLVGLCQPTVNAYPLGHLQRNEIDVVCTFRYAHAFPTAIDLVRTGRVRLEPLVTGTFPLDDVATAVRAPVDDPEQLKVLIAPNRGVEDTCIQSR